MSVSSGSNTGATPGHSVLFAAVSISLQISPESRAGCPAGRKLLPEIRLCTLAYVLNLLVRWPLRATLPADHIPCRICLNGTMMKVTPRQPLES